jgi:hypothetical protein
MQAIHTPEDLALCCNACWRPEVLRERNFTAGGEEGIIGKSPFGRFLRECRLLCLASSFEVWIKLQL